MAHHQPIVNVEGEIIGYAKFPIDMSVDTDKTIKINEFEKPELNFVNKKQGNQFRWYVNTFHSDYATKEKLFWSGPYDNDHILNAYEKFGQEYENYKKQNIFSKKESVGEATSFVVEQSGKFNYYQIYDTLGNNIDELPDKKGTYFIERMVDGKTTTRKFYFNPLDETEDVFSLVNIQSMFDDRTSEKKTKKLSEKQKIEKAKKENRTLLIGNKYYFKDGTTLDVPTKEVNGKTVSDPLAVFDQVELRERQIAGSEFVTEAEVILQKLKPEIKTKIGDFSFYTKESSKLNYFLNEVIPDGDEYGEKITQYNSITLNLLRNIIGGGNKITDPESKKDFRNFLDFSDNLFIILEDYNPIINEYYSNYKNNLIRERSKFYLNKEGKYSNEEIINKVKEIDLKLDQFDNWEGEDYRQLPYHTDLMTNLQTMNWDGSKEDLQRIFKETPDLKNFFEAVTNNVLFKWESNKIKENSTEYRKSHYNKDWKITMDIDQIKMLSKVAVVQENIKTEITDVLSDINNTYDFYLDLVKKYEEYFTEENLSVRNGIQERLKELTDKDYLPDGKVGERIKEIRSRIKQIADPNHGPIMISYFRSKGWNLTPKYQTQEDVDKANEEIKKLQEELKTLLIPTQKEYNDLKQIYNNQTEDVTQLLKSIQGVATELEKLQEYSVDLQEDDQLLNVMLDVLDRNDNKVDIALKNIAVFGAQLSSNIYESYEKYVVTPMFHAYDYVTGNEDSVHLLEGPMDWQISVDAFSQEALGSIAEKISFGDISSIDDLGLWMSGSSGQLVNALSVLVLKRPIAVTGFFFAQGSGAKFIEMDFKRSLGFDITPGQAYLNATWTGGVEAGSGYLTGRFLSRIGARYNLQNSTKFKNGFRKGLYNNFLTKRGLYTNFAEPLFESTQELGAHAFSLLGDKYILGEKDVNIWEGGLDVFATSFFHSSTIYRAPEFGHSLLNVWKSKPLDQQYGENATKIQNLENDLAVLLEGNPNLDQKIIKQYEDQVTNLVIENNKILQIQTGNIDLLSVEEKNEILDINKEIYNKKKELNDLSQDFMSQEVIQQIKNLEQEIEVLDNNRSKIIESLENVDYNNLDETIKNQKETESESKIDQEQLVEKQENVYEQTKNGVLNHDAFDNSEIVVLERKTDLEARESFEVLVQQDIAYLEHELTLLDEKSDQHKNVKNTIVELKNSIVNIDQESHVAGNTFGFVYNSIASGQKAIIVNPNRAQQVKEGETVIQHEFGHIVANDLVHSTKYETQTDMGLDLFNYIKQEYNKQENDKPFNETEMYKRLSEYSQDGVDVQAREVLPLLSDAFTSGDIPYSSENTGFLNRIGKIVNDILVSYGLKNIKLETPKEIYDFVKTYNTSIEKGGKGREARIVNRVREQAQIQINKDARDRAAFSKNVRQETVRNKDLRKEVDVFVKNEDGTVKYKTKQDFQSSIDFTPAYEMIANSTKLDGLIKANVSDMVRPEAMSDFIAKVKDNLVERLFKNFDPAKNESLFGWLAGKKPAIYYAKLDVMKEYSGQVKAGSIDAEDNFTQLIDEEASTLPIEREISARDKVRIVENLSDIDLENIGETKAVVQAEINALIETNPDNLQKELDKLIKKEFRKLIIKDMGKISQKKGQLVISDEYSMFFAKNYDDIVKSLSVDVIKNNYNNLFELTEVSKEDVKKIDEETGKTTYYRKGIFNIKGNKAIFTKYFTEGGYTTLKDRQSALATLMAESISKEAVDNYILENSNNENAIIDAKIRRASEVLDKNKNEFKSFDNVQFARQVSSLQFLDNLKVEIQKEVKTGKYLDVGRAAEQAINNILQRYEKTMPGLVVVVKKATEKDNMADLSLGFKIDENQTKNVLYEDFQLINFEIKLDAQKIKLTSKLITKYDFINDEVIVKDDNFETIVHADKFQGSKKVFKEYYERANELITEINNNRFVDKDGKVVRSKVEFPLMETSNDIMPDVVYQRLKDEGFNTSVRETNRIDLNEDHVAEHHGNKKHPAPYIEFIGKGLFSFGQDTFFNGKVPLLKMKVEGYYEISSQANKAEKHKKYGLKVRNAKPRFISKPIEQSIKASNYSLADQNSMQELTNMYHRQVSTVSNDAASNIITSAAFSKARPVKKYTENPRGMSAFDFDETLIIEGENFIEAKNPETGEIVKISSERWPLDGPSYANLGYTFDFKDFVNVRGGIEGPLLTKLRNRIQKYGPENNYILTARPSESATAIHGWLKTKNIDLPLENITGLGNSTGEAKAQWILGKFEEGYNDIYFVDDALPNVKAVADVINQLDIKGKSVQAKVKEIQDASKEFNKIIQQTTGVPAAIKFSDVQAKLRGKGFKFNGIIPSSAQDFAGLLYNLIGKGKQGEQQFDFLKKALIDPFARGIDELNTVRQKAAEDYQKILKELPEVKSDLNMSLKKFKKVYEGFDDIPKNINEFTVDQAVRVYLWNKAGFEIPGLSIRDQRALSNFVKTQDDLVYFAEVIGRISKRQDGYAAPSEYWLTENIGSDLMSDGTIGDMRADFLAGWIENKNEIFSKDNLNKLEALYGTKYVEALQDVLYRMETGRNRPTGKNRLTNEFMNWTNGAIGSIMFFNIRSAVLQTISAVNYVNWSDNNILNAGKAFANQPQYWKDFAMIFNSDFLKQRRAGNKRGVNEQELSQAVAGKGAYEQSKAAVRFLLKQGFLPTQIADSFAISAGGSSFYRNRVNTYIKKGLSKSEAETKAFLDFQETTEVSQQSGRPDLISQQQASPLGRLILAFGNYPMQAGRIMDKAARDLINGRGDAKTNVSKIIYYGFVANVLFQSLQSAIFAVIGDEDEDELDKKKTRILNGMIDTWFQTFGVGGKAISTIKNTIMEFNEQRAKDLDEDFMTRSDHAYTLLQALSFSPPISSKLRKIYQSIQTEKFNRDIIKERGLTLDNPIWSMFGNVVEGATNVPLGRIANKLLNLENAMDTQHETWKRLALIMGWNTWDLGIEDPDLQALGEDIKERKKQEKEMEKVKIKQQKLREKYPGLDDEQIEIKLKSKEIMDLRKHEQIELLKILKVDEKEILKLKKEQQRSDKIAELYKDNEETIDKYLENSKNKSKEQIQKEVEEYKKSTKKKSKKSQGNTTREKTLFKMKKSDQINLLLQLGYPNRDIKVLKYEKDRVAKIIELENKSKKR